MKKLINIVFIIVYNEFINKLYYLHEEPPTEVSMISTKVAPILCLRILASSSSFFLFSC